MGAGTINTGLFVGGNARRAVGLSIPLDSVCASVMEAEALAQLEHMARATGKMGGGGTEVNANVEGKRPRVTTWFSPSDAPALMVVVTSARTMFAFARNADAPPGKGEWHDLAKVNGHPARVHVEAAERIIRSIFGAQLRAARSELAS